MIAKGERFNKGDEIVLRMSCPEMGNKGERFIIRCMSGDERVGIESFISKNILGWHDLEGRTKEGYGWWVTPSDLYAYFVKAHSKFKVAGSFVFKNRDLEGMTCRKIGDLSEETALVEMQEYVGGGGGDGEGKQGHCIVMPSCIMVPVPKEFEKQK